MNGFLTVFQRELHEYFTTPMAYVFAVVFLLGSGILCFDIGGFYLREQADLEPFFRFHPWLYLFLAPALSMRLWSEERRSGSIELLMSLPITTFAMVLGKYLAAWCCLALVLCLSVPIWLTVNYLGDPDNLVILAGYIGSLILAGGFLAIGSCLSALSKSQVISFVTSVMVCFLFLLSGFPSVLDFFRGWTPSVLVEVIATFSFLSHFTAIMSGVIDLRDVFYFTALIGSCLYINSIIIEAKKAV